MCISTLQERPIFGKMRPLMLPVNDRRMSSGTNFGMGEWEMHTLVYLRKGPVPQETFGTPIQ